jgi:DNA polymerase III sliding clamp (beta) subunit (PCNA family)
MSAGFEIRRDTLYRSLDIVAVAMCTDDLRLHLAGFHLRAADAGLVLHSTDGHRLLRVETLLRSPISSPVEAFIDRANTKRLIKALRPTKAERDEIVSCELAPPGSTPGLRVTGVFGEEVVPLVEGETLPPYPKVIPVKRDVKARGAGLISLSARYLADCSVLARHLGDNGLQISIDDDATKPVRLDGSGAGLRVTYIVMPMRA